MEFEHKSVLLHETIDGLSVKPDGIYIDGTLGGGGHSYEVASLLKNGHLYCFDQDDEAIEAGSKRLKSFIDKGLVSVIKSNFSGMKETVNSLGVFGVDGIMLDLGVSSHQLDDPKRGFTYREEDAPLDMRMDREKDLTAADIINKYPENRLYEIIRDYGEDRFAKNIAKHIVKAREEKPILTAGELNRIIDAAIPMKVKKTGGHPSKRTYQALRIELNNELGVLKDHLEEMIDLLNPGGRLCVITFHSLEDRIVKNAFKTAEDPCICPKNFPVCVCGRKPKGRIITRKPIVASDEELSDNKRSQSAKLRVFEKKNGE